MKLQARETNYGTRIDYVLVTKGLTPWISGGDIQASLKGSDHCPIYVDLYDQITLESGETITLMDVMKQTPSLKDPPRTATKYWDEFSGKQTVLSAFFSKGPTAEKNGDTPSSGTPTPTPTPTPVPTQTLTTPAPTATSSSPEIERVPTPPPAEPPTKKLKPSQPRPAAQTMPTSKRKSIEALPSSKKRKAKGQASIASFFSKPSASASSSTTVSASSSLAQGAQEVIDVDCDDDAPAIPSASDEPPETTTADQLDADYRLALALAASPDFDAQSSSQSQSPSQSSSSTAAAWSTLFAPVEAPRCVVHDEPARLYTVNKQGPNRGKTFYLCARPVGPGWDKGRQERLREEVDHRYRCNFFRWASEVRREAMRVRGGATNGGGDGLGSGKGRT